MTEMFLLAIPLALGVGPLRVALLGLSLQFPLAAIGAAAVTSIASWRRAGDRSVAFCDGVATELRAGASIPQAVAASAEAIGLADLAGCARNGALDEAARLLSSTFPAVGAELAILVRLGRVGGAAADLFDEVAGIALADEEVWREVTVAAAPARAAVALFIVAPCLYLVWRWASGSLDGLFHEPAQGFVAGVGLITFLAGLGVAVLILRRAG
jgi:hypothetical protein